MEEKIMLNSDQKSSGIVDQTENSVLDTIAAQQMAAIEQGATLKDFYAIPDGVMDTVYACAYDKYKSGLLDDARVLFRFLLTQNIYHPDYALGLAAVFQRSKEYLQAADLYTLAFGLGQQPQAMFYAGQCYLNLRNPEQARLCFMEATRNGADEMLAAQARAYLSVLGAQEEHGVAPGETHG